jgi:hypothetical protein
VVRLKKPIIPDEVLVSKIFLIRDQKVMMDFHLAELYGVQTKVLKQAVRRNIHRFPGDFMFELSTKEFETLRSQIVTSNKGGIRYAPWAFTEHGVLMLSSVLRNNTAIEMNIQIVRIFVKMRQMLSSHREIIAKITQMESKLTNHDVQLSKLFDALKELLLDKISMPPVRERKPIGFRK